RRAEHDPFAESEGPFALPLAGRNRIEAPMDEQSVLRLAEPAESLLFLRIGARGGPWRLNEAAGDQEDGRQTGESSGDRRTPCPSRRSHRFHRGGSSLAPLTGSGPRVRALVSDTAPGW